jgi:hypothetical protein
MMKKTCSAIALLAVLLPGSLALAQAEDEGFDKKPDDAIAGQEQANAEKGEKMPGEKTADAPPPVDSDKYDPHEDPAKTYYFVGLRFRNLIVPKFMINIFADGGDTVNVFMFGPELTRRKDNTEFDIALSYADYSMDEFMFKGKDDGPESYEIVSSSLKAIYLTIDLLYDIPIDQAGRFSFLIGGGVGIGAIFGDLYRAQAYPVNGVSGDPDDRSTWNACEFPGAGPPGTNYCDSSNTHYGLAADDGYSEPSWANGGSKPFIFPWISLPQLSFRYKPIKQLQTRFDAGFSLSGFFLGLSAGYGL